MIDGEEEQNRSELKGTKVVQVGSKQTNCNC